MKPLSAQRTHNLGYCCQALPRINRHVLQHPELCFELFEAGQPWRSMRSQIEPLITLSLLLITTICSQVERTWQEGARCSSKLNTCAWERLLCWTGGGKNKCMCEFKNAHRHIATCNITHTHTHHKGIQEHRHEHPAPVTPLCKKTSSPFWNRRSLHESVMWSLVQCLCWEKCYWQT